MTAPASLAEQLARLDETSEGEELHRRASGLWPVPRSLTGDGVRETLRHLAEAVPLEVVEVPSGTPAFDWVVPDEWNVREAWIEGPDGGRIVDVADSSLHLLGYSESVDAEMTREELDPHLYSLPDQPDLVPYRTSYYQRRWGFCLPHSLRETLCEGTYRVRIDARLEPGHLTFGECVLPGESEETILVSAHVCHPALANDNLSALVVTSRLAGLLAQLERRRYTYRFVWAPGTIGAIVWLSRRRDVAEKVVAGLVAANLGDAGPFHYKRSRRETAWVDRAVECVLRDSGDEHRVEDFVPFGYDERQFCSPGFDLPVGSLTRTPWGRYPEYHTSADDLVLVRPEHLGRSLRRYLEVIRVLETDRTYRNLLPHCEPQLGKRGLYRTIGGDESGRERELALLWVLNQSDGSRSLLDVAERSGIAFARIAEAAEALCEADLLAEVAS